VKGKVRGPVTKIGREVETRGAADLGKFELKSMVLRKTEMQARDRAVWK